MKKTRKTTTFLLIVTLILSTGGCGVCGYNEEKEVLTIPTIAPVNAVVKASDSSTPEATEMPRVILTAEPEIIEVPIEVPTPTPEPTNTPIPIVAPKETAKIVGTHKMGDDVYFDLYDDGTLVVRGKGAIKSVPTIVQHLESGDVPSIRDREYTSTINSFDVKIIVIEEGITHIGDSVFMNFWYVDEVYLPTTLKSIGEAAFYNVAYDNQAFYGLHEGIDISDSAFRVNSGAGVEHENPLINQHTKPSPIPTVTPLPNPDKPRLIKEIQMGDNVIFEFWDNGYLYVNGSGRVWDKGYGFGWYDDRYRNDNNELYIEDHHMLPTFCDTITHIVIEEGVTEIGSHVFNNLDNIKYVIVPSTIDPRTYYTGSGDYIEMFQSGINCKVDELHAYWEGKPFTLYDVYPNDVFGSMWYTFKEKKPEGSTFMEKYGDKAIWE